MTAPDSEYGTRKKPTSAKLLKTLLIIVATYFRSVRNRGVVQNCRIDIRQNATNNGATLRSGEQSLSDRTRQLRLQLRRNRWSERAEGVNPLALVLIFEPFLASVSLIDG